MEKSEGTPIIIGTLFIYSELICSSIINVHTVKGFFIPSRRPLNKPLIVSNNFPGYLKEMGYLSYAPDSPAENCYPVEVAAENSLASERQLGVPAWHCCYHELVLYTRSILLRRKGYERSSPT